MRYDVIIAGGGIVGLATALQLQRQRRNLRIAVLEKESQVAAHQSSRNSGVIHSGIYYRPGSLRATNCKRGYDLLLHFCKENGIQHEVCGKIIVASVENEREPLDKIFQRGVENGLVGIRKISAAEAIEIEPNVRAVEAVWVPQAGIVDYGTVAHKYAEIFQANGGEIFVNQKVVAINETKDAIIIETKGDGGEPSEGTRETSFFVNCAGLYSDHVASLTGEKLNVKIIPFRGEYYELKPESEHLVRNLIYPVPNPNFPFLGVHFTRMIHGGIEAGPNAVLAFRREGYSRWELNVSELGETLAFPGFQKIARKFWREGWAEMQRSYSKAHFVRALQRLVPAIRPDDVVPGRSGVRAMACDRDGNLLDDFLILERSRILNVCNAPSPAATASLAIGETLAGQLIKMIG
ncbi:MAG: L-2-hydroxyglutarate oxidase [Phycisphaerae bacterium]|nr:L-2-hydroxyglutarate oxidase [Saprospiraceae bacterium]